MKLTFTPINERGKLSFFFDIFVLILCLVFYIGLALFIFSPPGGEFFQTLKNSMPLMDLVEGTIGDIDKMFGWLFEKISLNVTPDSITREMAEITAFSLLIDLTKLLLCTFIQSLIYMAFSFLFLHAMNHALVDKFLGDINIGKEDWLYYINSRLLLGISILTGGFIGSFIMEWVALEIGKNNSKTELLYALIIFVVAYIVASLWFMFKSYIGKGLTYGFFRSLAKTAIVNVVPEMFTFFVTNIIVVLTFNIFSVYKMPHIYSIIALIVFIFWSALSTLLTDALKNIFTLDLPFCGKKCPISGIFWLPATLGVLALFYIMAIMGTASGSDEFMETLFRELPFHRDWICSVPVIDLLLADLRGSASTLFQLFVLCNVCALLQYLSSSYLATLFTQFIGRSCFLLGVGFCVLAAVHAVMYFAVVPLWGDFEFRYMAMVVGIIVYIIYFAFQPYLALQGIFTTALMLVMIQFLPSTLIWMSRGDDYDMVRFITGTMIVLIVGLFLAAAQNACACFEKGLFKRRIKMAKTIPGKMTKKLN